MINETFGAFRSSSATAELNTGELEVVSEQRGSTNPFVTKAGSAAKTALNSYALVYGCDGGLFEMDWRVLVDSAPSGPNDGRSQTARNRPGEMLKTASMFACAVSCYET
jgi:hypothetical protein